MLSQKEVEHISDLARIELTEKDKEKFRGQLSAILDYFKKLEEIKTAGLPTTDGGTRNLFNVWRDDKLQMSDNKQQTIDETSNLIELAPEKEKGQVKVRKII